MGGVQSFLVDSRWLHKAVDVSGCNSQDCVFMMGADNGQLASMLSNSRSILLVEPDESIVQYLYSLELNHTTIINSSPQMVMGDEPFDKLLCMQPSLMSKDILESMIRVPFSKAVLVMPTDLVGSFRARDRLGTLLRANFDVEVINNVPMTAYAPKLETPAALVQVIPKNDGGSVNEALRLLTREAGTMRGLLTRSCREFFGYNLADAQEAVRMLDSVMLRKRFWELSEEEFKDVADWLRMG